MNKGKIAVSMGDPSGIGGEIILKSAKLLPKGLRKRVVVFGSLDYLRKLNKRLGGPVSITEKGNCAEQNSLVVRDVVSPTFKKSCFGKVDGKSGETAMASLNVAVKAVQAGEFSALVTAPINKASVNSAGYKIAGHTEYLSEFCGGIPVAMMLACDRLRVVVATTHIPLSEVSSKLSMKKIYEMIKLISASIKKLSGKVPKIAVCGLNPHASDGGLFGYEEKKIIEPAIKKAKGERLKVSGPYPADTMFTQRAMENYDVALAMYHDQGLIPVKLLGFGKTVNITLGLPFLRVSVDHGTAFDIAGKNIADGAPMAHAIKTAGKILRGEF